MDKPDTYIGSTFGKLRILSVSGGSGHGTMCTCVCNCSADKETICIKPLCEVVSGNTKSCGKCDYKTKSITSDIAGKTFGFLTALYPTDKRNSAEQVAWHCKCVCGNEVDVSGTSLRTGHTKSCGKCGRTEQMRADVTAVWKSEEDKQLASRIFDGMMQRCYNKNNRGYKNYGGRGIYICDEWLKNRSAFVKWAKANGYRRNLSIDRIDNDGPYSPDNCRWVDFITQQNNKRTCRYIELLGSRLTATEWARKIGIPPDTLLGILSKHGEEYCKSYIIHRLDLQRG